eukprot:COSAG02_NODE_27086_length_617_cov_0.957529_1_plen_68_part_00
MGWGTAGLVPCVEREAVRYSSMQAAAPLPMPLPGPKPGPRKAVTAYGMPGKYLSFEEKPFTDRLQAM